MAVSTFAGRWCEAVAARGDAEFLRWEGPDGAVTRWSYSAFDRLVDEVAGGLADAGVTPGARVSVALTNSPAFVAVWLALTKTGGVLVPSDPSATTAELAEHLRRTAPALGLCAPQRAVAYRAAAGPAGVAVVEVDEADTALDVLRGAPRAGGGGAVPAPADLAALMFTSGTTSAPKSVMVTQANYAFAGDVMAAAAALRPDDRQLVVLPMFHANAQYYSFASAIAVGASVALMPRFSASRFLAQAAHHHVTHASLFAAPIRMVLARGRPVPGLRLATCWYAQNITPAQYAEFAALVGCRPRQLYGMTETIPAVLTSRFDGGVAGSMGQVTLGCEVQVHDPATGRPARPGETGELVVRGVPGSTLFAGYLDDPQATSEAYRDGWLVTGDRARADAGGNFFFAGRRGDLLKVAGENVSTVEIEAVVAQHPAVLEVAVVGEADPVRDEVPVAYVVARPDRVAPGTDELAGWCAQRLAKAKRPARFELVDALPRTSVGKIRKFLLGAEATR